MTTSTSKRNELVMLREVLEAEEAVGSLEEELCSTAREVKDFIE
jgi:hypothetical protein